MTYIMNRRKINHIRTKRLLCASKKTKKNTVDKNCHNLLCPTGMLNPIDLKAIQNLSVFKYGAEKYFIGQLKIEDKTFD